MKYIYILLLAWLSAMPAYADIVPTEIWYAETDLNVREGPGVDRKIVDVLDSGEPVEVVSSRDGWSMIKREDELLCVCTKYLTEEPLDGKGENEKGKSAVKSEEIQKTQDVYLYGNCRITHYCNCPICCGEWSGGSTASGVMPTEGRTVACDLPFGTRLLINGKEYVVEDRGVSGMAVDVFVSSHEEALQKGVFYTDVYIIQ